MMRNFFLFTFGLLFLNTFADDDYSPEEAVKLFPYSRNSHRLLSPPPTQPPVLTVATLKLDPDRVYSIMNLDHEKLSQYDGDNTSLSTRELNPSNIIQMSKNSSELVFNSNKCLGFFKFNVEGKVVPILIASIEVIGVIANSLPLISFMTSKSMRNGHNMLLLNVVVSDLVYICTLVPLTSLHFSINQPQPSHLTTCRIGHYMIFVTVYVSMYSLVVTCLFGLMNGLCYNKPSDLVASHGFKTQPTKYLSIFSSGVLCLVVWLSFLLSHAHILLPSSNHLISSFIYQPFICNLPIQQHNHPNLHPFDDPEMAADNEKVKTLWVTFLTCAFIIPFLVVLVISAFVLFSTRSTCQSYKNNYPSSYSHKSYDENQHKANIFYESVHNKEDHYKSKRDLATAVLVTAVVRVLSWLPSIILLFVAAKVGSVEDETVCEGVALLKKFELMALCITLICSCSTSAIIFTMMDDFRGWLMSCGKKQKNTKALVIGGMTLNPAVTNRSSLLRQMNEGSKMNETIMSIISDSSNHINYLG